ncbi:MAG: dTDP-4-dehydrorhamnose 3,5-epimerase [Alphaproteobacteria bacterium]|nr:dTDP-4-dehydrorhamnose 3,5-epimerase [Alphaproteobacteria bacterium]
MEVTATSLPGVKRLVPRRFADGRGFFSEVWNRATLAGLGLDITFVQENHSYSAAAGTVRGLHFQAPPLDQIKLVRVGRGRILDVAVDARVGSPTYGRWTSETLSAEDGAQLLIPSGFLHGFVSLTPDVDVFYLVSAPYSGPHEGAVRWDDPTLAIAWGLAREAAILSPRDAAAPDFASFRSPFTYAGEPWA